MMTKKKQEKLAELLKELKKDMEPKKGLRSTASECCDFLIAVLGHKI